MVLGIERPIIAGWSDGGEIALQIGLRHPGLARALIVGGMALDYGSEAAGGREAAQARVCDAQIRALVQQSVTNWLSYAGLTREDVARLETPTLVVVGDRDHFVPIEQAVKLYRCLLAAELAILPGSDHLRPILDPEPLARVMIDFLQRHDLD